MDASQHYHHWAQNLADEAGYLRDPKPRADESRLLPPARLTDDEIRAYRPLPRRSR